jgi:hypothetical protein
MMAQILPAFIFFMELSVYIEGFAWYISMAFGVSARATIPRASPTIAKKPQQNPTTIEKIPSIRIVFAFGRGIGVDSFF